MGGLLRTHYARPYTKFLTVPRSHKGLNNRAENSHQPVRRRERIMKRFKSQRHLQRFVSIHDPIANLFQIPRHDISSGHHRELRTAAMSLWAKIARA
ncbi:DDE-type integrase/transposase/recombinase [Rhizobium leguminosarum]